MQIEIDFDVFKALTSLRNGEADSYNHVLRRLLKLPPPLAYGDLANALAKAALGKTPPTKPRGLFGAGTNALAGLPTNSLLAAALGGVWYNGVHLPDGTMFKANYKGAQYHAAIREGRWVGSDGVVRSSPSDAASAISNTNVNGWRFWHALLPGAPDWVRLDELRP